MAVAWDTFSESTAQADPQTHTHTPVGTPRGIAVFINHGTTANDIVSGVTYGGVAMTRVRSEVDPESSEAGRAYAYFLGSSIPTGQQTVSVDRADGTTVVHVTCMSVTADLDTEVVDHDGTADDQANPSLTLQYGGRTCIALAGVYSGVNSPGSIAESANSSLVSDWDFDDVPVAGSFSSETSRQTTPGSTDFTIGYTIALDDCAMIAIAVSEVVPPASSVAPGWAQAMGSLVSRVFTPRVRHEYWIEPGHARNTDPYTDTREG